MAAIGCAASMGAGSQFVDLMLEALHFALQHLAGAGRTGDRQTLTLHRKQALQRMKKARVHTSSDDDQPADVHSI